MPVIRQTIQHNSGIPLGGIGTGSVEIRPEGLFHEWHIFNVAQWNPNSPCGYVEPMGPEDLVFLVRTKDASGRILARYLALREELHDLYCLAWLRSVSAIRFTGDFPFAVIDYEDADLPVRIEAELFSPFVPLDSRTSGTPGFFVRFGIRNLTNQPVEVSILGLMKNPVGWDQENCRIRNTLVDFSDAKIIHMGAENLANDKCSTGDMAFACRGGDLTYITGSFRNEHRAMAFQSSRYGMKVTSSMHQFYQDGRMPNLNAEYRPNLPTDFDAHKLSQAERQKVLEEVLQSPALYDKYHRLAMVDHTLVDSPEFLNELADNIAELHERGGEWGWGALCSQQLISPEAESESMFVIAWYFPNHISPTGKNIGHMYEHWFKDAKDVAQFLLSNYGKLRDATSEFAESIHHSSMPDEATDAVASQLTTLVKCTWWTKAGNFGVWEGYGCCGFHTTDITYQGSFPIISLFPDLQKAQMTHGAKFQRDDGRVHHFFTPDFSSVDNGFDRVDMNPQFVMLAARDYLWTGDRHYLEDLWPHIVRAMDNTALLDTDGDGLPDTDTKRNTYDVWDFTGCPSYIASLWLGALKAGIRLAREMGDTERAAQWDLLYKKGVASFDAKLWNGEYYVLWRDGDEKDECCMSDQLSGDWFASTCGWGPILRPARIKRALQAIVRHNFRPGEGLVNASYPPGKKPRLAAYGNYQADAPWTGIEYTVASLLISYGLVSEGLAIVRDIHDRYLRAGRFWSHVECGSHYYRAMSSWSLLLALSGFNWDQPTGCLAFAPAIDEPLCEYPFFCGIAWGTYYQANSLDKRCAIISLAAGELRVSEVRLPKLRGFEQASVVVGDRQPSYRVRKMGDGILVRFRKPVELTPDAPLIIRA
jgi:uncharacterized protein (DUF608 family)